MERVRRDGIMDKAYIYFSMFTGNVKCWGLRGHLLVRGEDEGLTGIA